MGKSMLAVDILRCIAENLRLPDFLEVTVEDSEQMDLVDFDRSRHARVILDGVGDAFATGKRFGEDRRLSKGLSPPRMSTVSNAPSAAGL